MTSNKRWETIWFLFVAILINYTIRVNMSIAAPKMKDVLNWTEKEKGYVLSSFFWGYAISQIPATIIAERIGPKIVFGFAVFASSFFTILMPTASKYSLALALLCRASVGFASGALFPSLYHFFKYWIPVHEKTIMVTSVTSACYVGEIVGFGFGGFLVSSDSSVRLGNSQVGGWPSAFYVFGTLGLLYMPFYIAFVYSKPEEHKSISQEEMRLISGAFIEDEKLYESTESSKFRVSTNNTNCEGHNIMASELLRTDEGSVLIPLLNNNEANPANKKEFNQSLNDPITPDPKQSIDTARDRSRSVLHSRTSSLGLTIEGTAIPENVNRHSAKSTSVNKNNYNSNKYGIQISEIPWKIIFTHKSVLVLFGASWTCGWILFMLLSEIPSFLTDHLGYDLESAGILSIAPYVANFIGVITFAQYYDYMQNNCEWVTYDIRQVSMRYGLLGSGIGLVICGFMDSPGLALTFIVITLFFYGSVVSGIGCAYLDISPKYSSLLNTIGNTLGALAGIAGPIVVSFCVTAFGDTWGWRIVFLLTFFQCVITLLVWHLFQTSKLIDVLM